MESPATTFNQRCFRATFPYWMALLCVSSVLCSLPLGAQTFRQETTPEKTEITAQTNGSIPLTQAALAEIVHTVAPDLEYGLPIGGSNTVGDMDASTQHADKLLTDKEDLVSVGLLKKVAKPFYDRLIGVGYTDGYPWTKPGYPSDDTPATAEQAGQLFHFDLSSPLIVLCVPINGATYPRSRDIFAGAAATVPRGREITKIEFFADSRKIGEVLTPPYDMTWKQVPEGSHQIVAMMTDDLGETVSTRAATISVVNAAPKVTLFSDRPAYTQFTGKLHAEVLGMSLSDLKSLTLNGKPIPAKTGGFELEVKLSEGNNAFTLVATDGQGRTGQAAITVLCDTQPPKVAIDWPKAGASIGVSRINVEGTVSDASGIASLNINGMKAYIKDGKYKAVNVLMAPGAIALLATAADIAGNRSTATVTVKGAGSGPEGALTEAVGLQASAQSGFAPLPVTFTPNINVPGKIQEIGYDFDGDNVIDYTTKAQTPVSHIYESAGEFAPIVTVKTSAGSYSSNGGGNLNYFVSLMLMANSGAKPGEMGPPLKIRVSALPAFDTFLKVADPIDLAVSADGNVYVLSRATAVITEFNSKGKTLRSIENIGTKPCGLDIDAKGNVYVALTGDNQVGKWKPTPSSFELDVSFHQGGKIGNADQSVGSAEGSFDAPYDVAFEPAEAAVYVSDTNNSRIVKFKPDGTFDKVIGTGDGDTKPLDHPKGLCASGPAGILYVVDSGNSRVVAIERYSECHTLGSAGSGAEQFASPLNIAANLDGIYVVDAGNRRLQSFDVTGPSESSSGLFFSHLWSADASVGFSNASAVACAPDLLGTTLYLADTENNRLVSMKISRGDSPEEVWNLMKKRMAAHDIEGALTCFSDEKQEDFRKFFQLSGQKNSAKFIEDAGKITVISIGRDEAEYNIDQTLGGKNVSFSVRFIRENGKWKIDEL